MATTSPRTGNDLTKLSLKRLATSYFKHEGLKVLKDLSIPGESGKIWHWDFFLTEKKEKIVSNEAVRARRGIGVILRDWKRECGIDVVMTIDEASEDCKISTAIVSNSFSGFAVGYANKKESVILLDKGRIVSEIVRNHIEVSSG